MRYVGELGIDKELLGSDKKIVIYGASIGGYGEKIYR